MQNSPFPSYYDVAQLAANVPDYDERTIEILLLPEIQELVNRVVDLSELNSNGRRRPNVTAFTLFCRVRRLGCRAGWSKMTWDERKPWYMASDTIRAYCKLDEPLPAKKQGNKSRESPREMGVGDVETSAHVQGSLGHEIGHGASPTLPSAIDSAGDSATNGASLPHTLSPRRDSYSPTVLSPSLRELLDSDATSVHPSGSPLYFDYSGSSLLMSSATWPASLDTWTDPLSPLRSIDFPDFSSSNSELDPARSEYRDIPGSAGDIVRISTPDTGTMVNVPGSIGASRADLAFVEDFIRLLFTQTPPPEGHSDTTVRASDPLDLSPSQVEDTLFEQFIDCDAMEKDS
ncbi:hypothetical protein PLEOSDRAFT_156676 [Pleurotus ostreatus PC15]|uniref:Uncharacterized protein n=1 Tax=Pleurotus ostreatus (strain PC15) TaxID=1137138 RepID=A0A067NLI3_PLEO1|nr:hypothetical protein PLEOSDRAFT_156676 [Pleurotus ostreatus PC15]